MDEPNFPPVVEVINDSLTIWDDRIGSIIYSSGFFGKPLGLRKTKPGRQNRPLVLSLFDTLFLLENGVIQVEINYEIVDIQKFFQYANKQYDRFERKYLVYKFLRSKGYIVRPGMKFGSDFAVYEKGPGFDHSKWVVHVEDDDVKLKAINIVRAGRLAASVKKRYLISTIDQSQTPKFYSFDRVKI